MIKPPFTADQDDNGTWIENDEGVVVAQINHLIPTAQALELADLLANGANFLLDRLQEEGSKEKMSECLDHYYYIEEWIDGISAIGGKSFWYRLEAGADCSPNRFDDENEAREALKRVREEDENRVVRLVEAVIRKVEER